MQKDDYQNENQELKKLHMQRAARLQQTRQQQSCQEPEILGKRIIPLNHKSEEIKKANAIYLNTIIYDKRHVQQKFNNVSLSNFMHPFFEGVQSKPVSKQIEAIMMTNYGFQMQVFEPLAKSGVPFFVFNRDKDSKEGKVIKNYQGISNMTVISPPKHIPGWGVFHTKLWLIKFKTFLRVVVCTSNNHLYDWSVWQNAYWYHDCPLAEPLMSTEHSTDSKKQQPFDYENDFVNTLKWVVKSMQPAGFDLLKEMKFNFEQYSYKGITAVLIPSIPGRYKGEQMNKIGLGKVRKILKSLKIKMKEPTLTANCTSLGKVDQKFIREVYLSFSPSSALMDTAKFKLVYPTDRYIKDETCGAAEVLFFTPENYAKCQLKEQIFYKYNQSLFNGVEGGIPHLKTVVIQQKPGQKVILYVGSHNLTKAAWGGFQKGESQINCMNEELGLLFLDYTEQELLQWLPYRYPPEKYEATDLPYFRQFHQ